MRSQPAVKQGGSVRLLVGSRSALIVELEEAGKDFDIGKSAGP